MSGEIVPIRQPSDNLGQLPSTRENGEKQPFPGTKQTKMPDIVDRPKEAKISQSDPLTAFDRFITVYPRQASIGTARGRWMWALAKVGNDHDKLIAAAAACAAYHQSRHTAIEFIAKPHAWLDAEGWLDRYELPPAPVASPQEQETARLARLAKALTGTNKFAKEHAERNLQERDRDELLRRGMI